MTINKKGFTLVEIAVVIAIMAVLLAVLAPSLLRSVEDSRMQRDDSAMGEVTHAVKLALSDPIVLDEMVQYSCTNNYVTYTDSSGVYGAKYTDEEFWAPDGAGFATTITFNPEINAQGDTIYRLDTALVNDMTYGNGSVAQNRIMQGARMEDNQCQLQNATLTGAANSHTYAALKKTLGDTIESKSATYGQSSYTVFIEFEYINKTIVPRVHGEWNGTNLFPEAMASKGSGTSSYDEEEKAQTTISGGTTESVFTQTDLMGGGGTGGSDYKTEDAGTPEHIFAYYTNFTDAVNDINAGTIGQHADTDDAGIASAGIRTDGVYPTVVLMQNITLDESINCVESMSINLNGKKITSNAKQAIKTINTLEIIGNGGAIEVNGYNEDTETHRSIVTSDGTGPLIVKGGTYFVNNTSSANATVCLYTKGIIDVDGVQIKVYGNEKAATYGIYAYGQLTVKNSNFNVFANQVAEDSTYATKSAAIGAKSKTTKNIVHNCNINAGWYTVAGYVNEVVGGVHASWGNGMFLNGAHDKTIIVKNLTLKEKCEWPTELNREWRNPNNMVAFGGSNEVAYHNIYLSNCRFDGSTFKNTAIRVQGAYGENNCSFFMSNTQFNMFSEKFLSMYEPSAQHKVYFGVNCNAGPEHIQQNGVQTFITNESY